MRAVFVDTPHGKVAFAYEGWNEKPVAVMFHGFGRYADDLFGWAELLPDFNVVFAAMPGYGGAPDIEGGVIQYIRAFRSAVEAFPTPPQLVVGESLGALIAVTLRARLTVGVDPFLRTHKLWPLHALMQRPTDVITRYLPVYRELLADNDYSFILDLIASPTLIIGGDEALYPKRPIQRSPSFLDDEDFTRFAANPLVTCERIAGGHALLEQAPAACRDIILAVYRAKSHLPSTP